MNCPTCHRPALRPMPTKRFEDTYAIIVMLWAVLGIMAAGGLIEAMLQTHWMTFLVTLALYGAGTTILTLWWKIKTL